MGEPASHPPENGSAVLVRSLWQLGTYVLGAALVASWVWVWNTNNTLHELRATLLRLPETMLRAESNRSVLDDIVVRLARVEESAARSREDRQNLRQQDTELRLTVSKIDGELHALQVDQTRVLEILRLAGIRPARPGPERP